MSDFHNQADGLNEVAEGNCLAAERRTYNLVQIDQLLANANHIDIKISDYPKEVWQELLQLIKNHAKEVVPRRHRAGRVVKLETYALGIVDIPSAATRFPHGNIPMPTGAIHGNELLNEMYQKPKMVVDMDESILKELLVPLVAIPGESLPAQALVLTRVARPGTESAVEIAKQAAPAIGAVIMILLSIFGV